MYGWLEKNDRARDIEGSSSIYLPGIFIFFFFFSSRMKRKKEKSLPWNIQGLQAKRRRERGGGVEIRKWRRSLTRLGGSSTFVYHTRLVSHLTRVYVTRCVEMFHFFNISLLCWYRLYNCLSIDNSSRGSHERLIVIAFFLLHVTIRRVRDGNCSKPLQVQMIQGNT